MGRKWKRSGALVVVRHSSNWRSDRPLWTGVFDHVDGALAELIDCANVSLMQPKKSVGLERSRVAKSLSDSLTCASN